MKDAKCGCLCLGTTASDIVHHNIIILLTDSFLVEGSVNYIVEICPVETVDTSDIALFPINF